MNGNRLLDKIGVECKTVESDDKTKGQLKIWFPSIAVDISIQFKFKQNIPT